MKTKRLLATVVTAILTHAGYCQEVGSMEWFRQAIETARTADVPEGTYFEFRQTWYASGTEQERAALEAEIAGKPEHPRRYEFIEMDRRLRNGGDATTAKLWKFSDDQWRISEDRPFVERYQWSEAARRGDAGWRMVEVNLNLMSAANPQRGYDIQGDVRQAGNIWRALTTRGISGGPDWVAKSASREGDRWTGVLASPDGMRERTLFGTFDGEGNLDIQRSETTRSDDEPKWLGEWRTYEPDDAGVLPMVVKGLKPAKAVRGGNSSPHLWELIKWEPVDMSLRQSLTAIPDPNLGDPLGRPLDKLVGIDDRSDGRTPMPSWGKSLVKADPTSPPLQAPARPAAGAQSIPGWLTPVVAGILGVIILVLVVIRLRRA